MEVAATLGGVESLARVPGESSQRGLSERELGARGIAEGLVRRSLGIEGEADLLRGVRESVALPRPPVAQLFCLRC